MKRRSLLAALAAAPALPMLSACGGGDLAEGTVSLRLVNASSGYATLDLYLDGDSEIEGVARATCSDEADIDDGSYTASLRSGDSGVQLASMEVDFSSDKHYTLVAHGAAGSLKMTLLSEDEDDGEDGNAKLRVLNAATDAGLLEVLVGATGGDVDPVFSAIEVGTPTDFIEIGEGLKRLAVTPPSDEEDLRFRVDNVRLRDGQVATLVLAPTLGGSLVNALLLTERGDVETYENNWARLRVASGVAGAGTPRVTVSCDDVVVANAQRSATVGNYTLVNAGAPIAISVSGASVAAPAGTTQAGGDYSLVVYGTAAAPLSKLLEDDNRAPTTASRARIRAVHASAVDDDDLMAVEVDADTIETDLAYGEASDYTTVTSSTTAAVIGMTVGATDVPVASQVLEDGATYTLFLLASGSARSGVLKLDHSTS